MSKKKRRKEFENNLRMANTFLVSGLLAIIFSFGLKVPGIIPVYFWVRRRNKEKKSFGYKLTQSIIHSIIGLIAAPILYLLAIHSAIMFYLE